MKRNKIIFVHESAVLDDVVDMVISKAQEAFDEQGKGIVIKFLKDGCIPKKWGGYVLPINFTSKDVTGIKSKYQEIYKMMTSDVVFTVACRLYRDTRKQKEPVVRVALVNKHQKIKKSGILVYWKK